MKHAEKLLTPREAGQLLGFSPRTIARWCREGKIFGNKIGRVWRIPEGEVRQIIGR